VVVAVLLTQVETRLLLVVVQEVCAAQSALQVAVARLNPH
jgi:hypothetical protein